MSGPADYQGSELELFSNARNWKAYVSRSLTGRLVGRVVEVGAGLGSTTSALCGAEASDWLCLEPDPQMAGALAELIAQGQLPASCRARCGVVEDLDESEIVDVALYMDVLEHIENDRAELERIARHIKGDGRIIVLSPAHQWLFSPFDAAIGHFRRYRRADAARLTPAGWVLERAAYLDSAGLALSLANKLLLRRDMPTLSQVLVWDRLVVPISRVLDPLFGHRIGKSILFIWRRR
jgi:2-polyprenyl-3-methyl-5-hydroxy-6-metoxy-1,4-benzoquinol methylase